MGRAPAFEAGCPPVGRTPHRCFGRAETIWRSVGESNARDRRPRPGVQSRLLSNKQGTPWRKVCGSNAQGSSLAALAVRCRRQLSARPSVIIGIACGYCPRFSDVADRRLTILAHAIDSAAERTRTYTSPLRGRLRFRLRYGGRLEPGERLERPQRGSRPRVLPLDEPGIQHLRRSEAAGQASPDCLQLAPPGGVEPPACRLGRGCSILMSFSGKWGA